MTCSACERKITKILKSQKKFDEIRFNDQNKSFSLKMKQKYKNKRQRIKRTHNKRRLCCFGGCKKIEKSRSKSYYFFKSFFFSSATLLCCALPATFVFLGAGAVFASFTSFFPLLTWVSEKSDIIFILAAICLIIGFFFEKKNKNKDCQQENISECQPVRDYSKLILRASTVFYAISIFFAYVLPLLIEE